MLSFKRLLIRRIRTSKYTFLHSVLHTLNVFRTIYTSCQKIIMPTYDIGKLHSVARRRDVQPSRVMLTKRRVPKRRPEVFILLETGNIVLNTSNATVEYRTRSSYASSSKYARCDRHDGVFKTHTHTVFLYKKQNEIICRDVVVSGRQSIAGNHDVLARKPSVQNDRNPATSYRARTRFRTVE